MLGIEGTEIEESDTVFAFMKVWSGGRDREPNSQSTGSPGSRTYKDSSEQEEADQDTLLLRYIDSFSGSL